MTGIADLLARLAAIDTCALSDALDRLGLSGQVTGLRRESGAGRVAKSFVQTAQKKLFTIC